VIPRKPDKSVTRSPRVDPRLTLVGDVRPAPFTVANDGKPFRPDIAILLRPDDGNIAGSAIGEPGNPAKTLFDALFQPPGTEPKPIQPIIPGRIYVFDVLLARQLRVLLAPHPVKVEVTQRLAVFDEIFEHMAATLGGGEPTPQPLDVPDEVLKPLVAAVERFWRAKPWEYTPGSPPISVMLQRPGARPLFASILGNDPATGALTFYTSLDDFDDMALFGETLDPTALESLEDLPDVPDMLEAIKHQAYLISFLPKSEIAPVYRDQLLRCGWSKRPKMMPFFSCVKAGELPREPNAEEAGEIGLVVNALVTFCERQRNKITSDAFSVIEDTVELSADGQPVSAKLAWPADEDLLAPATAVYRLKVSLTDYKDVWRRIELTSNQTLENLHDTIQTAFGWDDDHLYAFFLSGKDWDVATQYTDPFDREPGERGADIRLDRLHLHPRQRLRYIFDFGDEWRHDIKVEKLNLKPDDGEYPRITDTEGIPPAQYGDDEDELDEDELDEDESEDDESPP
jgi:hypothetical protein